MYITRHHFKATSDPEIQTWSYVYTVHLQSHSAFMHVIIVVEVESDVFCTLSLGVIWGRGGGYSW